MLAPVYIFYGFESAGDIAEETKDASRLIPRAMRLALIWGGIASLILTGGLLLAMPPQRGRRDRPAAACRSSSRSFPQWLQDVALLLIIYAFFSCGTSIQGAGSRLAFSFARDGALPGSRWISKVSDRHRVPVNALLGGAFVTVLFILLVFVSPSTARQHPVVQLPGPHQRAVSPGLVRRQRHLPVVLPDGDRLDRRAGTRLDP